MDWFREKNIKQQIIHLQVDVYYGEGMLGDVADIKMTKICACPPSKSFWHKAGNFEEKNPLLLLVISISWCIHLLAICFRFRKAEGWASLGHYLGKISLD